MSQELLISSLSTRHFENATLVMLYEPERLLICGAGDEGVVIECVDGGVNWVQRGG